MTVGHLNTNQQPIADHRAAERRAAWTTPRVIVSDLGDARSGQMMAGPDGSNQTYGTPYGS